MEIRRKNENFVIKFIILKKRKQNFSQKIAKIHKERLKFEKTLLIFKEGFIL